MDNKNFLRLIAVVIITSIITAAIVGTGIVWWLADQSPEKEISTVTSLESAVINTVEKANPAVVAITVSVNVPVYERYFETRPGPFGFDFIVPQYIQRGTVLQEVSGGSGFLVSRDGYIVTNRHVVEDETAEYAVFLNDGRQFAAEVVFRDPSLDLAVIKISGTEFPYLPFGNSDELKVGQSVIAIGNALAEFRNTVSLGIISGLARSVTAAGQMGRVETLDQLIQTDAAINPGNSGGPLLNLEGEVIGVNVAVASEAENIGFALSSNIVKDIVESVRNGGN